MTTRKTITAILAAIITISVCCSCAAQTANSSIPEASSGTSVTADTTSAPQMTLVPQTTVQTTAPETAATTVQTEAPETATAEQTTTTAPQTTIQTTAAQTEAPKPATTTTAATTKPTPEWTESKANGTKYVNTSCYSRKKAVLGAETVTLYSVNDKVTVTAKTDTGYYKLDTGAYIHSDYLNDSKVAQPAAPTTKKAETSKPAGSEKVNFSVITVRENVPFYSDINCTNATSWVPVEGCEYTVVEVFDSKNCYKLSNGEYVKKEDVKKGKVSDIYRYPFDLEAIRQVIIDDAVNNYGLILYDDPTWTPEGSTWNAPLVLVPQLHPNVVRMRVSEEAGASFSVMKKGDYFKVYIETVSNIGRNKETGEYYDGYAIYFLQG